MPLKRGRQPKAKTTSTSPPPPAATTPDDAAALDRFCQTLNYADDLPMTAWQNAFTDLDLLVPVWTTAEEAAHGCHRIVHFCRSMRRPDGSTRREPAAIAVDLAPGSGEGQRLVFPEAGDQAGDERGSLTVIVRIKG